MDERHSFLRHTVAILSRGDAAARRDSTPQNSRFVGVFEALATAGIDAHPAIYDESFADELRDQLLAVDGVLVWVDPIHQGKTRAELDLLLREVAKRGPWVSAHPDTILKMGVKEVLYRTRHLGWGADTHLYDSASAFRAEFPLRLKAGGARVLKQNRGNGGLGVWKVEALPNTDAMVRVLHAQRGSVPEDIPLDSFRRPLRVLFRMGWLYHRSGISTSPARRNDPLLHERVKGRRLRKAIHQGLDSTAAGRPEFAGGATRAKDHAWPGRVTVPGFATVDGGQLDAADDGNARH